MKTEVSHDVEHSRYELAVDGRQAGVADYRDQDAMLVFTHTVIDPDRRGQGLGAVLVKAALDDVRRAGRLVVPRCWYVKEFIDDNPEYADLLAP